VILIIEDEPEIRRFLRSTLTAHGYRFIEAATADEGMQLISARAPDLIILDLGLPDRDGLELMRSLRAWTQLPIVVVSGRGREAEKVAALDLGADDYLTKPFGVDELLARVRVALRHANRPSAQPGSTAFQVGDLEVDLEKRRVLLRNEPVHLTPIEYRLLTTLVQHAGMVLTHRQLLREALGPNYVDEGDLLRVHMARLRRKLEQEPAQPRYILTEPGVGYRLAIGQEQPR
jgi:two-component system KDP operon response regulator KdpE